MEEIMMGKTTMFGTLMKLLRLGKNISLTDLHEQTDIPVIEIESIENESKIPPITIVKKITDALNLSDEELDTLMNEYDNVRENTAVEIAKIFSPDKSLLLSRIKEKDEIDNQINELKKTIDSIDTKINIPAANINQETISTLTDEFGKLRDSIQSLQSASDAITAPVSIPAPEEMEVKLIASNSLDRLEEYRDELNLWYSITGITAGAALGQLLNLVTGSTINNIGFTMLGFLTLFTAFGVYYIVKFRRKINNIRSIILG